jgi:AcrR family transcriptional regulator
MVEQGRSTKSHGARKYELKERAESVADTRRRITEAAVELHGSIGPAATTISAVAERAGVTRLTVYRHFPTVDELFGACSAMWLEEHAWPSPQSWAAIGDPGRRLHVALSELYAFLRKNHAMVGNLQRDIDALPQFSRERLQSRVSVMTEALIQGRGGRGTARKRTRAVLGHAVEFETWRSFALDHALSDSEIVGLMEGFVESSSTRA